MNYYCTKENEGSDHSQLALMMKQLAEAQNQIERLGREVQHLNNALLLSAGSITTNMKRDAIPRSCYEARLANPTLQAGNIFIDPDGNDIGEPPIQVYCDAKGTVRHIIKTIE